MDRRAFLQGTATTAALTALAALALPAHNAQGATMPAFVDATTYGVKADGMTDCAPGIRAAWGSGAKLILLPPGVMILGSPLNVPTGVTLAGAGMYASILSKGFHGDAVTLGTEAGLMNLRVEGNGSSRTGGGVTIPAGSGRQNVQNVTLGNHQGPPLKFATLDAGSQSTFTNLNVRRSGATVGSGLYAIEVPDGQYLASCPRTFIAVQSNGLPAFNLGGANGLFISGGSVLGRMRYTAETRAVQVSGSRLLNEDHWDFRGHANTITGCDIRPRLTVKAGSFWCTISGNAHNLDNPVTREGGAHTSNTIVHSGRFW
jgi:hypothetical protein